jgi:hypothetical protein
METDEEECRTRALHSDAADHARERRCSFVWVWLITIPLTLGTGCQASAPRPDTPPNLGTLAIYVEPDNIWLFTERLCGKYPTTQPSPTA